MIDSHCHLSFKDLGGYSDKTINFVNNASPKPLITTTKVYAGNMRRNLFEK